MELSPQIADAALFDGEGGSYHAWTPAKSPVLAQAKLGAGKLTLQPRGFALPHYADSSKIGYVTQGTCTVGLIMSTSTEEKVVVISKGTAIPVPIGTTSWWFNGGDSDMTIIFLGETNLSYTPGTFNYFFLAGALGFLGSFTSELVDKAYQITQNESQILAKSQTNALVVKLDDNIIIPSQSNCNREEHAFVVEGDVTGENFPSLEKIGLSTGHVKVKPNSVLGPYCNVDGSYQMVYVIKGSGKVEIVGRNGKLILDANVEEGQLFVVPKFFIAAFVADEEGMEVFSVTTSGRPLVQQFNGNLSAWKAMPSSVLQASLNVEPQFAKILKSNHGQGGN